MRSAWLIWICLVGLSCSDDDAGPADAGRDTSDTSDAAIDPCSIGQSVFDDTVVHELNLRLSDSDWASMIAEAEASPEYGGPDKTYFNAELEVDGTALASPIAVRLKGHFSLISADGHSFPLKLDFDRVDADQDLDGLSKVNLHPNQQGVSVLREFLSYGAIREHGMPTARVGFARVTVNGESLGLYSMVEHIKGKFIRCHYDAPFGDLYKPEEPIGNLDYLGPNISDYEPLIQFKWPDVSGTDHASLLNLIDVVNRGDVGAFDSVLEVDKVLTYFAMNVGLGNFDYYATFGHNYYLYESTPGRFEMIAWDMNFSQGEMDNACGLGRNTEQWPVSHTLLADPARVQQYLSILETFLRGAASPARLNERIDAVLPLLASDLETEAVSELRDAIADRVESQRMSIPAIDICPEGSLGGECETCVVEACEAELVACEESPSCPCLLDCDDDASVCLTECGVSEAPAEYDAFLGCVFTECIDECS